MDRTRALYERPAVTADDQVTLSQVKQAIETKFSAAGISDFLRSLDKSGLRIRNFEDVLAAGRLGNGTPALYASLSAGDQGQVRELYLARLEQVPMPLRDKFFKLYAYY